MRKSCERCHPTFIEIYPTACEREIIVDFMTMETAIVKIELKPFAISKYPVTNQQYYRFLEESGYHLEVGKIHSNDLSIAHWRQGKYPEAQYELHPVTFVSYDDASAYAAYMSVRLPTYHEWLYAAFGSMNKKFPWGDTFCVEHCNVRESGAGRTTPVGHYSPQGDSVSGCCDMVGNVWEWTSTPFGDDEDTFWAMGTGWDHYSFQLEISLDRWYQNRSVGFRVVRDLGA